MWCKNSSALMVQYDLVRNKNLTTKCPSSLFAPRSSTAERGWADVGVNLSSQNSHLSPPYERVAVKQPFLLLFFCLGH